MVMPAVFIGLGTSGTEIIHGVRRHLFEEYGRPGLPCIRFLRIETHANLPPSGLEVYLPGAQEDWEQVKTIEISLSMDRLQEIKNKIDPTKPAHYHRGWAEIFDKIVFNKMAFDNGAGGWRMAGRLCLWDHWATVHDTLASTMIASVQGIDETHEFLGRHAAANPDGGALNGGNIEGLRVYICGSLCGGTCSDGTTS